MLSDEERCARGRAQLTEMTGRSRLLLLSWVQRKLIPRLPETAPSLARTSFPYPQRKQNWGHEEKLGQVFNSRYRPSMSRPLRLQYPGAMYSMFTARGNARQADCP